MSSTKAGKSSSHRSKKAKREEITQELGQLTLLGEIISFSLRENRGIKNQYKDVIGALQSAGLDEKIAREFTSTQAFNRACNKLKEERVIDEIRSDKDHVLFQFSKRHSTNDVEDGGNQFEYRKEVKILLEKATGKLTCKDDRVREDAQRELDRCMEERTTSDISNMVDKLFQQHADLIPIGVGVFFVPEQYTSFTAKVQAFLGSLGRKMVRFPVPAGTGNGDQSVQEAVENHVGGLIENLDKAIDEVGLSTRPGTIEGLAERINSLRDKIKAYTVYLKDKTQEWEHTLQDRTRRLLETVEKVVEEKKSLPPGTTSTNTLWGYPVSKIFMWAGKHGWTFADAKQAIQALTTLSGTKEASLRTAWSDGKNPKYCKAPELSPELVGELEQARDNHTVVETTVPATVSSSPSSPTIEEEGF